MIVIVVAFVIICNESVYISSCLIFYWLELTSITIVLIGITLYELVLHYNIISYHISCSLILSLLLISSPYIFFSIVSHIIEWFVSICPSVCLSVYLCEKDFVPSSSRFSSLSSLFPIFFFFFSHERLPHTPMHIYTHTHTHWHSYTYEYMFLLMTRTYYFKRR